MEEMRALTGIRGIAALYVVFFHCAILHDYLHGPLRVLLDHGYLAVDLFFVLSGFVMAMTHGNDFRDGFHKDKYKTFLIKRLARIYPLYAIVLMITLLYYFISADQLDVPLTFPMVILNFLLVQAWGFGKSYVGAAWSVSTEMAVYIIFPILSAITLIKSEKTALVTGLCCMAGIIMLPFIFTERPLEAPGLYNIWDGGTGGPLLRCVFEFSLGLLCYRFYKKEKKLAYSGIACWLVALLILLLLMMKQSDIGIVLLLPVFIFLLSSTQTYLSLFFGSSLIYWLGTISYSLYLIHRLVFSARPAIQLGLENLHLPHAYTLATALQLPLILILATFSYYYIEKPARHLIRVLAVSTQAQKRRRYLSSLPFGARKDFYQAAQMNERTSFS